MSDRELLNELRSMLLAGDETTASSLARAFYWVHYIPEVRQKIIAELNSLEPNTDPTTISKFEMKLVLATVLSEVKLELLDRKPLKPVLRGVAFTPSGGVKMVVTQ